MTRRRCLGFVGILLLPSIAAAAAEPRPVRVVVWDEQQPAQKQAYPNFLGNRIAEHLSKQPGTVVKSVRLDDPEQGLSKATLDECDVLVWWGHVRQREVKPETGREIVRRIKEGKLSLVALHSAHWSTPFVEAMWERSRIDLAEEIAASRTKTVPFGEVEPKLGVPPKRGDLLTPRLGVSVEKGTRFITLHLANCCFPSYRADGKPSHVRVLKPGHPIVKGIPERFDIPKTEMYDEPFHVPAPDEVVFEERWDGGEHFRSGSVWKLGKGKVFYFRPGHETYPVFEQAEPLRIIENAVRWLGSGQ